MGTPQLIARTRRAIALIAWFGLAPSGLAQLGGFQCPTDGAPAIRQGDSIAKSGGRFDSSRENGKNHGALDLNGSVGDPVYASLSGHVAVAQKAWLAMGNTVIIDHGSGAYTVYGHLETILVNEDEDVVTRQKIGTIGYTGNAAALKAVKLPPHLHFAVIQAGQTGLAAEGQPLRRMKEWGDYWQKIYGADYTGAVNPVGVMAAGAVCWTGSTTANAPGEH